MSIRWCTTTDLGGHGDRKDHGTLDEAQARAGVLAALVAAVPGAIRPTRMTIWHRLPDDPRGWQSWQVIDLNDIRRAGAA